jgi:Initiator Replication protein
MEIQKQAAFQNIEAVYSGDLTFWELIILGKLLPLIRLVDADYCAYTIPLNDFMDAQSVEKEQVCDDIFKAAAQLLERRICWTYLETNGQIHQCQTTLLGSVDVVKNNNIILLEVTIQPKLKRLLLSFKTEKNTYDFLQMPFLTMSMSHRLYLLLLQNITHSFNSFTINIEKLKVLLEISDKYTLYANFKIKILKEAQKRLLEESNVRFDFSEIKTGQKITALRFRIDKHLLPNNDVRNNDSSANVSLAHLQHLPINNIANVPLAQPISIIENPINAVYNKDLIQKISKKFGVTQRMLKKLAEDFSEQSLQQAMLLTEKAIEKGTIKGSAAGFFVEAVRQNYQATEEDEQTQRQAEARQKAEKLAQIETEQRELREALKRQEFEQERDAILEELAHKVTLQKTISERIRYSIFHASFDVSKTFDENLENPSFVAAVLNFYKIIKKY